MDGTSVEAYSNIGFSRLYSDANSSVGSEVTSGYGERLCLFLGVRDLPLVLLLLLLQGMLLLLLLLLQLLLLTAE